MSYKYIGIPKSITYRDCHENDSVFAPSKYSRFIPQSKDLFVPLSNVCQESKSKVSLNKKRMYTYSEIGDIDVSNGTIIYNNYYGINIPSDNPKQCKKGDILVSTVRTYRGGIGMVAEELENHCCSPAILVIRNITDKRITAEYLLAILRTDFFIEQILGFQTRGMYPRLDSDAMDKVLIPIPEDENVVRYISLLSKAYQKKYNITRERHSKIIKLIDEELNENQQPIKFSYQLPKFRDVSMLGRLDTGLYNEKYLRQQFVLSNYKYGASSFLSLNDGNVVISRGQNLQESNIGKSIYLNEYRKGYYALCLSKYFTNNQTLTNYLYVGNKMRLKTIKPGEIIFSCRGEMGRSLIFCDSVEDTITNIDNVHIEFPNQELYKNIYISQILGYLKEKSLIKEIAITGSGADSFTKYQFDMLLIPNFPEQKQKEIAELYYNSQEYNTNGVTLDNFLEKDNEFNSKAGIYELDKAAKQLKTLMDKAIDDIVNDREVAITFDNK